MIASKEATVGVDVARGREVTEIGVAFQDAVCLGSPLPCEMWLQRAGIDPTRPYHGRHVPAMRVHVFTQRREADHGR